MKDLRQYDLARIASHAWPRCAYRLVRIHDGDADAPATFQVVNGTGGRLGKLTVSVQGVFYGGFPSSALSDAVSCVRVELRKNGVGSWPRT